jgi:hypothetical protein
VQQQRLHGVAGGRVVGLRVADDLGSSGCGSSQKTAKKPGANYFEIYNYNASVVVPRLELEKLASVHLDCFQGVGGFVDKDVADSLRVTEDRNPLALGPI